MTSLMERTRTEVPWIARMAASRPGPGPLTKMSTSCSPKLIAAAMTCSAATLAAKGVLFLDPLKPDAPALLPITALPSWSEIVTIVLLKEAWI